VFEAEFRAGDALVFGKESRGLPREVVDEVAVADGGGAVVLPMAADERSLNLATAVCAAVYEGVRQLLARGEVGLDGRGRLV
jgi:tRNA (cytidine/uridine-2'-O-)-methyltransferase